jgi:uncharacterized protein (TIGR03437 family)
MFFRLCLLGFCAAGMLTAGRLPLGFERNQGQTDGQVRYLARALDHTLFLTAEGAVLRMARDTVWVRFHGGNRAAAIDGLDQLAGHSNYLGAHATTGIAQFGRVRYRAVWPGIDVVFHGEAGQLEYDFVVAPGADPRAIRVDFDGVAGIAEADGEVVLRTSSGELRQRAPVIYQGSARVAGAYLVRGRSVRFHLAAYDRRRALIIDPVLSYNARFGTHAQSSMQVQGLYGFDRGGTAIAVDAAGNAYVVGSAFSADFPTTPGVFQPNLKTGATQQLNDVFIMKLNPAGSALVYSTFLGGSDDDVGLGIALDPDGNAYVCGMTRSKDFPVTAGAFQTVSQEAAGFTYTGFVAKLNPAATALVYSTYLGGPSTSGTDVRGIALDAGRNAYVTGVTSSIAFPITAGAFQPTNPANSGFPQTAEYVAKLNPTGSALVYSTYLAPSVSNFNYQPPPFANSAIAVDSAGNAYIGGVTNPFSGRFPTTPNAFQPAISSKTQQSGFVSELNASGSSLVFSTYLAGSFFDGVDSLALGPDGSIYVTGHASSPDFPTTAGAFQPAPNPEFPPGNVVRYPPYGFIARLKPDGSGLIYSTYIGGGGAIVMGSIAVDGLGNAYVAGAADSSSFLTTPSAIQPCQGDQLGFSNAFLLELDPTGSRLLYSTFLGGNVRDQGFGLALDRAGKAYITGMSDSTDFAPTPGAAGIAGGQAFVAKVDFSVATPFGISCVANSASMVAGPVAAGEIVSIFGNGLGPVDPQAGTITNGAFDTSLAGTQVLFDGVPAPMLMVSNNQVNAIVPSPVRFRAQTVVQVEVNGTLTPARTLEVVQASPAIFTLNGTGTGRAAVLNADGTVNSPANPAARGSFISLFANSAGAWQPSMGDGLVVTNPISRLNPNAGVTIDGGIVGVVYEGNSLGSVSALWQINVLVPFNVLPRSTVMLHLSNTLNQTAQRVTIAVN